MPDVFDPYVLLGLEPGTPMAQVKARFRHLAKKLHPDRNGSDPASQEQQRRINAAYEFLSDPVRKADYDAFLARQDMSEPQLPKFVTQQHLSDGFAGVSPRVLPFLVFWAVVACVTVAVLYALSGQTLSLADPVPTVTVVEPTGPVVSTPNGQPTEGMPGETLPTSSGTKFWPTSTAPTGATVPPAPPTGTAWPARDTGSFPSQ